MKNKNANYWKIVLILTACLAVFLFIKNQRLLHLKDPKKGFVLGMIDKTNPEKKAVLADMTSWKTYENKPYRFSIRFPDAWDNPIEETPNDPDFAYVLKVSFGSQKTLRGSDEDGFEIYVSHAENCLKQKKLPCQSQKTPDLEKKNSQHIQFSNDKYLYDMITTKEDYRISGPSREDLQKKFALSAETFAFLPPEIERKNLFIKPTSPIILKSKIAPVRIIPKKGRHCPVKKDRPGISSYKENHMDEDCCADYDEWPKPGCFYAPEDYALMLKGPTKGHIKHP
jgi:hypothetical protein